MVHFFSDVIPYGLYCNSAIGIFLKLYMAFFFLSIIDTSNSLSSMGLYNPWEGLSILQVDIANLSSFGSIHM